MNTYLTLKWLHILSSVLLVGTGFGSAFYLFFIHRTKNLHAIHAVIKLVVRADWWFTTPAVIIQPLTGLGMIWVAGMSLTQSWLMLTYALYVVTGLCWLPVVWLQIQMRNIVEDCVTRAQPLPPVYWRYARTWEFLGYPAFLSMLLVYWLMVTKPSF